MPRFRSHLDQSTFILFIHVQRPDIPQNLMGLLENSRDEDALRTAWKQQYADDPNLFFHEHYHYWQGLRLPFLYRYALMSFRVVLQAYRKLADTGMPLHQWNCMLPELHRLGIIRRVWWFDDDNSLVLGGSKAEPPRLPSKMWELTPQRLLETAASLAEFQVLVPTDHRVSPLAFRRWRKRNPVYREGIDIVEHVLGDEALALRVTLPIINAAFETSEPVRAFAELLAGLRADLIEGSLAEFIGKPEPLNWPAYFDLILDDLNYASSHEDERILGSPYHRISLSNWLGLKRSDRSGLEHPFLTRKALEWSKREEANPAYRCLLSQPAWVETDVFWSALTDLMPDLEFVRFHLSQEQNRIINLGDTDIEPLMIKMFMTLYGVVRRASGAGFDEHQRLCHHEECPEYAFNFCNSYPAIPSRWQNCQFLEIQEYLSQTEEEGGR